jgi:hypothetical protein
MTTTTRPRDRIPRGDRDRRLSLGLTRDAMAAEIGITVEQLRRYESTPNDEGFSLRIAERVGLTLERLETTRLPLVYNGPFPVAQAHAGRLWPQGPGVWHRLFRVTLRARRSGPVATRGGRAVDRT